MSMVSTKEEKVVVLFNDHISDIYAWRRGPGPATS